MKKAQLDPNDRQARRKIEAMVFSSRFHESGDENFSYAANSARSIGSKAVMPAPRVDSVASELDFDKCSVSTILDNITISSNLVSTLEPSSLSVALASGGASPIQVVQDSEELLSLKHQYLISDHQDPTEGCCKACIIS